MGISYSMNGNSPNKHLIRSGHTPGKPWEAKLRHRTEEYAGRAIEAQGM